MWSFGALLVGSTGHVFVHSSYTQHPVGGGGYSLPVGVQLDELDSHGAYVGKKELTGVGGSVAASIATVFGVGHHAFSAKFSQAHGGAAHRLESDAVSFKALYSPGDWGRITGTMGNADGELFAVFDAYPSSSADTPQWIFPWGTEPGHIVVKWNRVGAHVFTKNLTTTTEFAVPGNLGDLFVGGASQPGFDLGCGPLLGAGVSYVARIDTAGQCLWSRLVDVGASTRGHLRLLDPAADGSTILVDESFQGTVDAGCGPMTSAVGGSSFVAKLDVSGACLWSKSFSVPSLGASRFPSGDLLLSAQFAGTLDLGGGPLTSVGDQDVALARLDVSGVHLWSKSFGNPGVSLCVSAPSCARGEAFADATGSVLLGGPLTGWVDFGGGPVGSMAALSYAVKFDGSGAFRWQRLLPNKSVVKPDGCGAAIVANPDSWIDPLNSDGTSMAVSKLAP